MRIRTSRQAAAIAAALGIVLAGGGAALATTTHQATPEAKTPDTDNVQQGDQSGPDTGAPEAPDAAATTAK